MASTTLLIDADILAYQHSAASQETYDWGEGITSVWADDPERVQARMVAEVESLKEELGADEAIICLTDKVNFRHSVLPSYKSNRVQEKPVLLADMKKFLEENFKTFKRPGLEADDVMGILSTHPKLVPGRKIIVSIDKDMKQIPGWLYNPNKHTEPVLVMQEDGDYFHMFQTLTGDPVDGYKGCPKIGKVNAEKILMDGEELHHYSLEELWFRVVETYEAKGLTEADALVQARVAKICQWTDYDYKHKKVKLWNPKTN